MVATIQGRVRQPNGQGPVLPKTVLTVADLSQQKGPCSPDGGVGWVGLLKHIAKVTRRNCAAGRHRTSLTLIHLSKIRKFNLELPNVT